MEGGVGSSSNPCLMGYNNHHNHHNNNGFSPLMLMMPHHHQMHNSSSSSSQPPPPAGNTLFLPTHYDLNRDVSSSLMLGENPNLNCSNNNNNNNNTSTGYYFMETTNEATNRDKIMAHPHYHRLLSAYSNCQKIGAPPEVVAKLEEACASAAAMGGTSLVGEDPALDQFMEAYCEMLIKYEQELSKPFKEAMLFLSRIECQFKALILDPSSSAACAEEAVTVAMERNGSSEEEMDVHIHHQQQQQQEHNKNMNMNMSMIDPQAEDRELKGQLLRKYSGYLGNLKQEFMKKRKKGKLPKEARQHLLDWWTRHYKWPYPSESQKVALAEATGLDQKQINNWFINQRKRHWKPSEDMQFVVMDAAHPHHHHFGYMADNLPFPMDIHPAGLL